MATTPDPTAEGKAYRDFMFGLVAGRDPAAIQEQTAAALRALIGEAGDRLRVRPDGEWSALEVVGHIVDAEIVSAFRYRQILSHDEPEIAPYDQDRWVAALAHGEQDPEAVLRLFEPLREANLALWRRSTAGRRARAGLHAERGRETFEDCFVLIAGHDLFHLDQARATLEDVR